LKWAATDPESNKAMVWDNECAMVNDPERSTEGDLDLKRSAIITPESASDARALI
jgi:hypothetical protein